MENLFWKPFILFLSLSGIPIKIIVDVLWRFDSLKPIIINDWVMCRMIEFGVIKWYDLPHLHSYLIHRRIEVEFSIERKERKI